MSVKSYVTPKEKYDRIVVLVDMDAFYCQVEEYLDEKHLKDKPIAVVQYLENAGIIAVNYPAKALGVTRHMREKEAKAACPELICVKVPSKNGKADLTKYRDAGYRVAKVLQQFTPLLERASVDEAYLDITDAVAIKMQEMRNNKFQLQPSNLINTFAVGYESIGSFVQDVTSSVDKNFDDIPDEDRNAFTSSKLRLLIGASIVNEVRKAVKEQTQYECSAGIAHNKILAKLTCGMNKPNKQTILPIESISGLFQDLAVNKVKSLGGKLGEEVCSKLNVKTMADLLKFSENELQHHLQNRIGSWLYWMARGIDLEKVTPKFMSKSIAVSKNFRGKNEISSMLTLKFWLKELAKEVVERLEKDAADCNRTAKQLIVSFTQGGAKSDKSDVSSSRTVPLNGNSLNSYTAEQIADEAFETIKRNSVKFLKAEGAVIMAHNIKHLGISAGKFEDDNAAGTSKNLQDLLKNHHKRDVKKPVEIATAKCETTEEASKVLSKSEAIASIRKFELKSPKPMAKRQATEIYVKPVENAQSKERTLHASETNEDSLIDPNKDLKASESFHGIHAIKGLKTLKHWITQLLSELCGKLKIDCEKNNRAPKELILNFVQFVNGQETENVNVFSLDEFSDDSINIDAILETFKRSNDFLREKQIQHPITRITLVSSGFEEGREWKYSIKSIKTVKSMPETPTKNTNEEEADESIDDNVQEVEKEEESEADDDLTKLEQPIPLDSRASSPDYENIQEESLADTEEIPTMDDIEEETTSVEHQLTSTSNQTNTSQPSYMKTYAEFQPTFVDVDLLNPKEPCAECGKLIAKLEMISHLDHHLAFEISNTQREEYRQMNKVSMQSSSSQSVSKKAPKGKTQKSKPAVNLIEKYAVKKEQLSQMEDDADKTKCENCQKYISNAEYVSHLDYHFAQKLREESMQPKVNQKIETKRKRPGSTQKETPRMKSMKSYFATN